MLALALAITACSDPSKPNKPAVDTLLYNGNLLTLDEQDTRAQAMVVHRGNIVAIGSNELEREYSADHRVDLRGRTVMPGFNDTHVHINGKPHHYIELSDIDSIEEMMDRVREKAVEVGSGNWITGYGWSEDELIEQRRPLRGDLDAAAPENPVMLTRAGAHSAVFSSRALALAGLTATTPDPEGGTIERHPDGTLNGIIRERHEELVGHLIPETSWADLRSSLVSELQALFALGITSITHANADIDYFSEWEAVYAANSGELPRASVQVFYEGHEAMANFGRKSGDGDEYLKVGPIKIFADGGFTGPAAYTKRPYKGEDEYRGALNMSEKELGALIEAAHTDGWQLGIHAIGDAAIELVVKHLGEALDANPRDDHRHYLNHFTVMPSIATMDEMARRGIAITQQPNFLYTLEGRYTAYLDGERLAHNNPMATPMERGVHVAMSSDILPLGPWVGIYASTTRKGMSGAVYGAAEKIPRLEALRAYTSKGAWLTREEDSKGMLRPGMWADFIVLQENPLTVDDDTLLNLQIDSTWLAGRKVWSR